VRGRRQHVSGLAEARASSGMLRASLAILLHIRRSMEPRPPNSAPGSSTRPVRGVLRWIGEHVRGFHAAVGAFLTLGAVTVAVAGILFAILAGFVLRDATLAVDEAALRWIGERRLGWLDVGMLEITALGGATVVVILSVVAGVLLWLTDHRYSAVLLGIAAGGSILLNHLLKAVFARARPDVLEWVTHAGPLSFPSGHSMNAVAAYGTLAYLIARLEPTVRARRITFALATVIILLIGTTRVYLGVHYPSDVIGGFLVGLAWAVVCGLGLEAVRFFRARRPGVEENQRDLNAAGPQGHTRRSTA
jgi:undecaprenyl-diphosphatase